MELNLKSFLSISYVFLGLFFTPSGCEDDTSVAEKSGGNNKLLVVVDQSASVSYQQKRGEVGGIISDAFNKTYKNVKAPTAYFVSNITTHTNVVAKPVPFNEVYPDAESMGRASFTKKIGTWRSERNKWINTAVKNITQNILTPKSGDTDVYSVFQSIDMISNELTKSDTLNILFFSDMKQSTSNYELESLLKTNNPEALAKKECARILKEKGIKPLNNRFHCNIRVAIPDQFQNSGLIVQYWNAFFKVWGLNTSVNYQ
jgi:hypothetical protein